MSVPSGGCELSGAQQLESVIMDRGVAISLGCGYCSPQLAPAPLVVLSSYLLTHSELRPQILKKIYMYAVNIYTEIRDRDAGGSPSAGHGLQGAPRRGASGTPVELISPHNRLPVSVWACVFSSFVL